MRCLLVTAFSLQRQYYKSGRHYVSARLSTALWVPTSACPTFSRNVFQECFLTRKFAQVITVPAYFGEERRQATLRAAQIAGIPKVQLLQGNCRN